MMRSSTITIILAFLIVCLSMNIFAQPAGQYRGFWVDTFNTALNNHNDVMTVINSTKQAQCNAIFVQMRRRADSWYLKTLEPMADRTPIAPGFDPLADLIREAHAAGIQVHAFVIIGAIWNNDPTVRVPESIDHIFNKHGYNRATGKVYEGRANWLTRTLLPDGNGIAFNGYRIGSAPNTGDFWIDLGHPDAAQHTLDALMKMIANYDLDGLHLDRIRYPDISGTQSGGISSGYNETNVARFQARYGISAGSAPPAANDPRWSQWRRDQVTNFVRRVYLNAYAIRPRMVLSAALIAYNTGPVDDSDWPNADCYWRVFQDWRAWTEEGILDYAIPMNYKREHVPAQAAQYDAWIEWTKNHAYDRGVMIGMGNYLNSIEGSLRQVRRALQPSAQQKFARGAVFFSFANTNEAVIGNPHSIPAAQNTPRRGFAEMVSGLATGKSVDGTIAYEDVSANPTPVFANAVPAPSAEWKASPVVGHLMGIIRHRNNAPVDSAEVQIWRIADGTTPPKGRASVRTATDGNGFYGGVDLAPGVYRVTVTPVGENAYTSECAIKVIPGIVVAFDLLLDRTAGAIVSVSAGSYCGSQLSPEAIATIFGNSLAAGINVATTVPLPTVLGGTTVKLRDSRGVDHLAPLFFVSPTQVNYLVPGPIAHGPASLSVLKGEESFTGSVNVASVSPSLFSANADGRGVPAAILLKISGGIQTTEPVAQFNPMLNRFVARPISLGADGDEIYLILFGTGIRGRVDLDKVRVLVGGVPAEISYAGTQGSLAGLDQVNVRLPRSLAGRGEVEVVLLVENYVANVVQIHIQ